MLMMAKMAAMLQPVPEPAGGPVITMTAGTSSGRVGYATSDYAAYIGASGAYGSITGQPLPGAVMVGLTTGDGTRMAFDGDVTALLEGKTLVVDGAPYTPVFVGFSDYTEAYFSGLSFSNGVAYEVQIV